jgi:hypothetical protein
MKPRALATSRAFASVVVAAALSLPTAAHAYTIKAGDMTIRPVVGASVNVLRLEVATRETSPGGLVMGFDFDYSFDGPWNVTATFRPSLWPGYVDAQAGAGVKYRVVQLEAPFIPYASAMVMGAVGGPLRYGAPHVNLGVRTAAGVDYFVMRNLAVGLEAAVEGSGLFWPLIWPEASAEVVAGVTWRF